MLNHETHVSLCTHGDPGLKGHITECELLPMKTVLVRGRVSQTGPGLQACLGAESSAFSLVR